MYQVPQKKSLEIARSVLFWDPQLPCWAGESYRAHPFYSESIWSCLKWYFLCKILRDHAWLCHYAVTSTLMFWSTS